MKCHSCGRETIDQYHVLCETCADRISAPPVPPSPPLAPKCWKCGAVKVYDLFKGIYCPRCNDWC